jgi:hypothetical protein
LRDCRNQRIAFNAPFAGQCAEFVGRTAYVVKNKCTVDACARSLPTLLEADEVWENIFTSEIFFRFTQEGI